MIWQVMLDSGVTLGRGASSSREKARATLRGYNARARASQRLVEEGKEIVSMRLAVGLVAFKPRIIAPPPKREKHAGRPKRAYVRKTELTA